MPSHNKLIANKKLDETSCAYCGRIFGIKYDGEPLKATVEHVIPRSVNRGKVNKCFMVCYQCNQVKFNAHLPVFLRAIRDTMKTKTPCAVLIPNISPHKSIKLSYYRRLNMIRNIHRIFFEYKDLIFAGMKNTNKDAHWA